MWEIVQSWTFHDRQQNQGAWEYVAQSGNKTRQVFSSIHRFHGAHDWHNNLDAKVHSHIHCYLWLVGNKSLSKGNNVQGAGYCTYTVHLGVAIHSPQKVQHCLVEPYNVPEWRTSIPLTIRAEGTKTNTSIHFSHSFANKL